MNTILDLATPLGLTAALGPELLLIVGAMILLLWAGWRRETAEHQRAIGLAGIVLAVATAAVVIWYVPRYSGTPGGLIAVDGFRWMADLVILAGTVLTLALAIDDHPREGVFSPEAHVLVLLASSGMMVLAAARDLIVVFLGIELMSISVYALAGINRRSAKSAEGALKYFLLGAFSTAFLLYGIALVYGATGTTHFAQIAGRLAAQGAQASSPMLHIGLALLVVGFGFKVALVPFHMWAPDVYDGSPSPITAYMAATVKAAAFFAFVRVWLEAFHGWNATWGPAIQALAIATMVVGNLIGLAQRNIKRMLAYSSIAHAGYVLVALATGTAHGASAMLFYMLVYTLATFGAFALVTVLLPEGETTITLDDLAGLWSVRPWLAAGMTVIMLALLGFPIFGGAGFFAKWYVLQAALEGPVRLTTLAVVLVLTTVVSAGYYLGVVMVMFMKPRVEGRALPAASAMSTRAVLVTTVLALLALGVAPDYFVRTAAFGAPEVAPVPGAPYPVRTGAAPGVPRGTALADAGRR